MVNPEPGQKPGPQREVEGEDPAPRESLQDSVVGWLKAVAFGVRDTWEDVVREGRAGAQKSSDARWARYEAKTHSRRKKDANR